MQNPERKRYVTPLKQRDYTSVAAFNIKPRRVTVISMLVCAHVLTPFHNPLVTAGDRGVCDELTPFHNPFVTAGDRGVCDELTPFHNPLVTAGDRGVCDELTPFHNPLVTAGDRGVCDEFNPCETQRTSVCVVHVEESLSNMQQSCADLASSAQVTGGPH